jgi:hypothetical protein
MAETTKHKKKQKPTPKPSRAHGPDDNVRVDDLAPRVFKPAAGIGGALVLLSFILGYAQGDHYAQFQHSYLVAFMYVLSIGLGALWWVTLQHLVAARWSIVVRRIGELLAYSLPMLAVLSLPIVLPALAGNSSLFPWVSDELMRSSHTLELKRPYLNVGFFTVRWLIYFGVWGGLAWFLITQSVQQDESGDEGRLTRLKSLSAPAMIAFALTTTFAAIDFLMTLDPMWFSTIFGVYYFAGCVIAVHCVMSLTLMFLQSRGRLTKSITVHHYHDLGKMTFAFTVFWAYIAFSQFMLIWYANIPEETLWYHHRSEGSWMAVGAILVVCHFFLPFLGLLSRHVKRHRAGLAFWSVWLLVVHYLDLYYLIMPQLSPDGISVHLLDVVCLLGLVSLFIAYVAFQARSRNLIPVRDPRLARSLAFENF